MWLRERTSKVQLSDDSCIAIIKMDAERERKGGQPSRRRRTLLGHSHML